MAETKKTNRDGTASWSHAGKGKHQQQQQQQHDASFNRDPIRILNSRFSSSTTVQ